MIDANNKTAVDKYGKAALTTFLVSVPGIIANYFWTRADNGSEAYIFAHLTMAFWLMLSWVGLLAAIVLGCLYAGKSGNRILQVLTLVILASFIPMLIIYMT